MKPIVSGLINRETTLKVEGFPIGYYPIAYPYFGIASDISGVAYNVARALRILGDEVQVASFIGKDEEGRQILSRLEEEGIGHGAVSCGLRETPVTVVLYDEEGRRQIHCDLKDIQEMDAAPPGLEAAMEEGDLAVLCNINFNRPLLHLAKDRGWTIATDVHVLSDIRDGYNREFMEYADILFLSDERLPCAAERFLFQLKELYPPRIIVIGCGKEGALLYERSADRTYRLGAARIGGVVNTLGAGDALFSGFLHYHGKGYPALEALTYAEVFAALKIRSNGAAKGFRGEAVVEKYHKESGILVEEVQG